MLTATTTHTNDEQWTGALVLDSLSRVWQLKDKWICVTKDLEGGSPMNCAWTELVARHGPLTAVQVEQSGQAACKLPNADG